MSTEIIMEYTAWVKPVEPAPKTPMEQHYIPFSGDARPSANRDFFVGKSLVELAREQGVAPIRDIGVFAGGFPEGEDLDELLAELDKLRRS